MRRFLDHESGTDKAVPSNVVRFVAGVVCFSLFAGLTTFAQQGLNDMVFTVGTTQTDAGGRPWAYLLWQGTKPELTSGKQFAIYAKSGDASSPALYTRKAIIFLQPDPLVIQTLLNRAVNLGESLPDLDDHINALFQKIIPTNTLSLAQKVSAVIQGAAADPEHYNNLILLSRVHPGVSLCLGFAHAELIPPTGLMTYEVREYDKVKGQDIGVVGRVTVDPANPIVLPPPGPIAEFIDSSAKGDLNVKIRWATPPALRRLALLNYGFNVYRMTRTFAESNSYHVTPPTPAVIQSLTQTQPLFVRRLNRPPVLKSKDFDSVSVADFSAATGDPTTYFMMDDNGRYDSTNGVPFVDGDQYYYFVTARDVLGRDGLVSPGLLVKVCDRMPPLAPKGLRVINDYSFVGGVNKQVLKLIWNQNTNPPPGVTNPPPDITTAYYIYRWSSPSNMNALWQNPTNNLIKIVPHVNNQGTNSYVDDGAGSPNIATDASKTFWYSVRALDAGACGGNLSGNSAPAFGVLRDRVGPDAPSGHVFTQCAKPTAAFQGQGTLVRQLPDTNYYHIQLNCDATTPGIAWAEFYLFDPKANILTYITRQHFLGGPHVQFDYLLLISAVPQGQATIYCRVADVNGKLSTFAATTFDTPTPTTTRQLFFTGLEQVFTVDATSPQTGGRDCDRHISVVPGTLTVTCITGSLTISAKAQEWKVYRRVDNGDLSLIEENFFPTTNVWKDCGMPVNSGSVCYYAQYFDEQGNASSFVLLACLTVQGTGELPIPVLSPIESTPGSTQLNPMMTLR
ncbi:MAG TPA: hypothetical protein VLU94_00475, partial [Candidatus Nitrosotalea sp.]|nr:hypothetical protein [Candidatus Nitrosotalea sp.]